MRALRAQLFAELLLASRRGESVLVTLVIPAALLLFFSAVPLVPVAGEVPVAFLLPGTIGLAVIATAFVSLGIATAYERHYGVLKRLGGSPLPRPTFIAAKALAVLVIELVQLAVLVAAALALGWRPGGDPLVVAAALLLGTGAFAGLGLLLAGTLRAELTLAVTNGLFLGFLLLGDIVVPLSRLPEPLATVSRWLPATTLADALREGLTPGAPLPWADLAPLAAWAVVALGAAAFTFRVEE
ncbi:MAG: ABC transporter [Chloroflexi bacterium GWC2_73_18]|nr:MAG: ABC transporter [Chloroflexi bacterium GWC2_73_18]